MVIDRTGRSWRYDADGRSDEGGFSGVGQMKKSPKTRYKKMFVAIRVNPQPVAMELDGGGHRAFNASLKGR